MSDSACSVSDSSIAEAVTVSKRDDGWTTETVEITARNTESATEAEAPISEQNINQIKAADQSSNTVTVPAPAPVPVPATSPFLYLTLCALSFFAGVSEVFQAGANIRAGSVLGAAIYGSFISFSSFIVTASILSLFNGIFFSSFHRAIHSWKKEFADGNYFIEWYDSFSWFLGVYYVTSAVIISDIVGFSIFFVCSIAGWIISALLMDHFGWLGFHQSAITPMRAVGAALAFIGAILMQDYSNTAASALKLALCAVIAFFSGVVVPFQAALTTRLQKRRFGSTLVTSWYCAVIALLLLLGICGVYSLWAPITFISERHIWWQWFGGCCGCIYVLTSIVAPRIIGMSLFTVLAVAGQLLTSIFADGYGIFFPPVAYVFTPIAIAGVCIAFVGAAIIGLVHHFDSIATAKKHAAASSIKVVANGLLLVSIHSSANGPDFVQPIDAM